MRLREVPPGPAVRRGRAVAGLPEYVSDAAPADPAEERDAAVAAAVVGEVEGDGATLDLGGRDEAPVAGVVALVAVVAEHEVAVLGDDDRAPVVARGRGGARLDGIDEVLSLPAHVGVT